jgi:hypothetical protein
VLVAPHFLLRNLLTSLDQLISKFLIIVVPLVIITLWMPVLPIHLTIGAFELRNGAENTVIRERGGEGRVCVR